jgi:hypothetical protein
MSLEGRVEQIRARRSRRPPRLDRESVQERLAKLVGGVDVIRVVPLRNGDEGKEGRSRTPVNATRAAVEKESSPAGCGLFRCVLASIM